MGQDEVAPVMLLEMQKDVVKKLGIGLPIVHSHQAVHNQVIHNAGVLRSAMVGGVLLFLEIEI